MPAPPATPAPDAPAPIDRQMALLERLAELAMEVAEATGRQALAAANTVADAAAAPPAYVAPPAPAVAAPVVFSGDPALAFDRAARTVRRSVALWSQLTREKAAQAQGVALRGVEDRRAETEARRARAERLAQRIAEDHFEAALPHEADDAAAVAAVQGCVREARERLADEDLFGDLVDRPFSEIVERLCADLGLSPDWPRLALEPWAQAEIAAGVPDERGVDVRGVGLPLAVFARNPGMARRLVDLERSASPAAPSAPRDPWAPSTRRRRRLRAENGPPPEVKTLKVMFVEPGEPGGSPVLCKPPPNPYASRPPI